MRQNCVKNESEMRGTGASVAGRADRKLNGPF